MNGREKQTLRASMAILAMPICTALGLGFGVLFGAAAGIAAFGLLYAWMSRQQNMREKNDGRHSRD